MSFHVFAQLVESHLQGEALASTTSELIAVLDQYRLRVLYYSGTDDLICNSVGTDALLNGLLWSEQNRARIFLVFSHLARPNPRPNSHPLTRSPIQPCHKHVHAHTHTHTHTLCAHTIVRMPQLQVHDRLLFVCLNLLSVAHQNFNRPRHMHGR
jgi:hypothetical protein